MIELRDVGKYYRVRHGRHTVFEHVNLRIERGEKIGIFGRNGAGKSTLIRLLSGAELPSHGTVHRNMSVSWPLAFGHAFQGSLTGLDNIRFICRVYDADAAKVTAYTEEFSELGPFLREPVKTYSSGMRARLAFAISMAVEFDCFLIDEVIAVGDARFHDKCQRELFEKRSDRAMVIVSHETHIINEHCSRACVLDDRHLVEFPDVAQAHTQYTALMQR